MLCKLILNKNPEESGKKIKRILQHNHIKIIHASNGIPDNNYWKKCSEQIGVLAPMEEDDNGNKTGNLFTDIKYPWNYESNSFSHSNTRQPLHTDGSYEKNSPQISFFYCMEKPKYGGQTIFVSLENLLNYLKEYDPNLLENLNKKEIKHFKGNDFKIKSIIDNGKICWNYFRCENCELKECFHNFLENYVVQANLFVPVSLNVGEALFFKDDEILHGRCSFIGKRWLVKGGIYV